MIIVFLGLGYLTQNGIHPFACRFQDVVIFFCCVVLHCVNEPHFPHPFFLPNVSNPHVPTLECTNPSRLDPDIGGLASHSMYVEVKGQHCEVSSVLPSLCDFWKLNKLRSSSLYSKLFYPLSHLAGPVGDI